MTSLADRIAQFRKMATDDPQNELGHFSLGKVLMEAGEHAEAAASFARTVELNGDFSKAFQLLAECQIKTGATEAAQETLRRGYEVADRRGDNIPRQEIARLMGELGMEPPAPRQPVAAGGVGTGDFACQRPGCPAGGQAQRLAGPPMNDALGRQVYDHICSVCWKEWLGMGIKVINEMRLDLSDERAQQVYDNYMKDFLGLT
ncbi:MAG TPA: Fe(2+)-trafficking protein [Gemmatales bacterium]|nr:Fe(2+)-trafficking protein [Gemmatales bacterium]